MMKEVVPTMARILSNRTLRFAAFITLGFLLSHGVQYFLDTKRPSQDEALKPILISTASVATSDRWIEDYNVFVAASTTIRTQSRYLVMLVVPKAGLPTSEIVGDLGKRNRRNDGLPNFELAGMFDNQEVKPVEINPRILEQQPGVPAVVCLDLINVDPAHLSGSILRSPRW